MSTVLVVGSVALDTVQTPFEKREDVLGGSASFFSVVSSLITPVRLVAVVGQDFPEEHVGLLAEKGVDLSGLTREQGRTFRWSGRYLDNMVDRETLDTQLNVFEAFDPELPASYRDSEFVFLANIHPALQLKVLGQVQALLINDEELRLLSGEHNLVRGAAAVRAMGPDILVVKRGDAGALLFDSHGMFCVPAVPLDNVVDPTGAGDTFAGGFVSYLAHKGEATSTTLRQAMVYGSVVASFCVEDFSLDRLRTLTRVDTLVRCALFKDLTEFEDVVLS